MLVIDANIAIKLVTREPGSDEALARIEVEEALIAPDWLLVEAGHALWRKVKLGLVDQAVAEQNLAQLPHSFEELIGSISLAAAARRLAFDLDHWIYDCFYLALALSRDARLLTADRKFWNAAERGGYGTSVELLTWPGQR